MKIYNTTTNEFVHLEINDPGTNTCMASDIICNSCHDLESIEIVGEEVLAGDNEMCEWWKEYCSNYDKAESDLYKLLDEKEELIEEYYNNHISGVEFNDVPMMMKKFVEENK